MSDIFEALQKIAADRNSLKDWESNQSDVVKQERALIRSVQQNNDNFAMKELVRRYRGVINETITSAPILSIMSRDMAYQYAVQLFKEIIKKNFDLNQPNMPVTYIKTVLPRMLDKVRLEHMDLGARKSAELTRKTSDIITADNFLRRQLNREPTAKEEYDFITKELGHKIEMKNIDRIKAQERRELSGNQILGTGDTQAETLTLMDIKDVSDVTPEQIYKDTLLQQRILALRPNFTKNEWRFIMNMLGLGQFQGKPAKSLHSAAVSNNMTQYEGQRVVERLKRLANLP